MALRQCVLIAISLLSTEVAPGAMILSDFDVGSEAWMADNVTNLMHVASGGNPGGYLQGEDLPLSSEILAPAKFLGDLTAFNLGMLSFDHISISGAITPPAQSGRVTFVGATNSASALPGNFISTANVWTHRELQLTSATFGVSEAVWLDILSNVVEIRVVIDTSNAEADEVSGIDNFRISDVPEPSTLALLGMAGLSLVGCRCRAPRWPWALSMGRPC